MKKRVLYNKNKKNDINRVVNSRKITALIGKNQELIISSVDINKTAKSIWGDSGVEFFLTIHENEKKKFASKLNVKNKNDLDFKLLDKIYNLFGEKDTCFNDIIAYLENNEIIYKYERW